MKSFRIQFANTTYYNKGDVLHWTMWSGKVTKVYRPTWWRKLFRWMGFNVRINQVKIECL